MNSMWANESHGPLRSLPAIGRMWAAREMALSKDRATIRAEVYRSYCLRWCSVEQPQLATALQPAFTAHTMCPLGRCFLWHTQPIDGGAIEGSQALRRSPVLLTFVPNTCHRTGSSYIYIYIYIDAVHVCLEALSSVTQGYQGLPGVEWQPIGQWHFTNVPPGIDIPPLLAGVSEFSCGLSVPAAPGLKVPRALPFWASPTPPPPRPAPADGGLYVALAPAGGGIRKGVGTRSAPPRRGCMLTNHFVQPPA